MGKIIFILGGARSGKSRYALELAGRKKAASPCFIATCEGLDGEMRRRIALHRKARPSHWETFEEPKNVSGLLEKTGNKFDLILVDCLTLLVSNLMLKKIGAGGIEEEVAGILKALKKKKGASIIVSNEVGLGIVPRKKLARSFRDMAGRANQMVARDSDEVIFMVSGIPWRIK